MVHLFESVAAYVRPWFVVVACLVVVGAVAAVWWLDIPVSNVLLLLLVLACPLSHLLLGHGGHNHSSTEAAHGNDTGLPVPSTQKEGLGVSGNR